MKNQKVGAGFLRALLQLTIALTLLLCCNSTYAGAKTWTGAVNTDWMNPGNWQSNGVPGPKDDVTIPNTAKKPILTTGISTIHSLNVQKGATLTQSGGTLSVLGGSVQIVGTFNQTGGSLFTDHDFKLQKGGIFNQSGTGLLHMAKDAATIPRAKINIAGGATVNQSGGTIYTKDYNKSSGVFNQKGPTALFKIFHDWKPGAGSVFNSTSGTVQFTGVSGGGADFGNGTNQFNNILIDPGAEPGFNNGNNKSPIYVSGNFTNNNPTFKTGNQSTFIFNGTSNQAIYSAVSSSASATLGNLIINNNGGTVLLNSNANVSGNISLQSGTFDLSTYTSNNVGGRGTLKVGAGTTMRLGGNTGGQPGNNFPVVGATSIAKTSTTEYYGSNQTLYPAPTYGNVLVSSTGTKTAGGNLNIAGSFTLNTATFVGGSYTQSVGVNWTMTSGVYNNTGSTVNFNGTGVQNITSIGAFDNININKASGTTNLLSDVTANGTLNFTKGIITTGNNKMIIPQGGSVTGASSTTGWVNGSLQKYMASTAGGTFEVGDPLFYSPISETFSGAFTPGSIIAKASSSASPNISSSTLATKNISQYWTLTKPSTGAASFTTTNLTFNWNTADNYTPLNPALLKVGNYNSPSWSYPAVSGGTISTITATGVTTLGDFAVGEVSACTVSSGFSYSASELCTSGGKENVILNAGATAGTYTATPVGLSISNKGAITPGASTPGIYTITNTVAGACPSTSTTTVKISSLSAGISYPASTYCQSQDSVDVVLTGTTGGTFSSTAGLIIDDVTGRIDLASSAPGTYTVSYTVNSVSGCPVLTTTCNITVTLANYANISYLEDAYCLNGGVALVNFDGAPGGTFSSTPGLSIDPSTGSITLASCTPGTYTVTYSGAASNGCAAFTASTTITITAIAPGTISYTGSPFCYTTGIAPVTITGQPDGLFSSSVGLVIDDYTGDIDIDSSASGVYTVVYSFGGCYTTAIVKINNPAVISYNASPYCSTVASDTVTISGTLGGTFSAAAGLTLNATSGDVTPATSTGGSYTVNYTIPASNGCAAFSTTAPVTIITAPSATIFYDQSPFCSSDPAPQLVTLTGTTGGKYSSVAGLVIDSLTGKIIPASSTPGTYTVTYTLAATGPCPGFVATTTVTVTPAPYAIISYPASAYCKTVTTAVAVKRTGNASGTYSSTAGLSINSTTGAVVPSSSTPGTYTVTYTVPAGGGCAAFSATTTITITATPSATISYSGGPFCTGITTPVAVNQTGTPGGLYSSTAGLSVDVPSGAINPSLSTPKTYTVTYAIAASGGCAAYSTSTSVTVTQGPSANISYAGPFCNSNTTSQLVTKTGTAGGVFSSTSGLAIVSSTGTISPSSSTAGTYVVSYTIAASGSCPAYIANTSVTITAKPSATITYPANPYCSNGGNALVVVTGTSGGTFSSSTGLSLDPTTGTVTLGSSTPATYNVTYSFAASGGCSAYSTSAPVTINLHAVWNGSVSRNWHDANNWSCGGVPTITSNAIIPSGLARYPIIYSGTATTNDLTIQTGASVVDSAALTIAGSIYNSGFINAVAGKVELAFTSAQTIPSSLFYSKTIQHLQISNPAGVSINGPLRVTGSVGFGNVNNSIFTTGDSLTLASVPGSDAQIKDITNAGINYGNVINGLVTVERYMPPKRAYRFLTAPVNSSASIKANWMENAINPDKWTRANPNPGYGTNITGPGDLANGFDPTQTHNPSVFTFNNTTQSWVPIPNTNGLMSVGDAYRIIVRGDRNVDMNSNTPPPTPTTLRAKGTVMTGNVSLTKPGAGGTAGITPLSPTPGAYNLIANPYPSAVNWLTANKTDLSATIYIFDPNVAGSNNRGGYVAYNTVMGTCSDITSKVDNYLQSGQAFFVQTTGTNPFVTFKETDKVSSYRPVFRTATTDTAVIIQLLLPTQQGGMEAADGAKVYFSEQYSNAIGNEDSYKFTNQDENLAVMNKGIALCIEGRKPVTASDSIQLKLWQLSQKNYVFKFSFHNFSYNIEAYLKDKYLSTLTQLNTTGETTVPIAITSDPASLASDRYEIIFETVATLPLHLLGIKALEKNNGVEVGWTAESEGNVDRYEVEKSSDGQKFETAGRVPAKANPGPSSFYTWFDLAPNSGDNYYRIKSVDKAGDTKYSSVAKVKWDKGASGIAVFPNPAQGKRLTLQFTGIRKGNYKVTVFNGSGEKVYRGTILHETGSASYSIELKSLLPAGVYKLQVSDGDEKETISILVP